MKKDTPDTDRDLDLLDDSDAVGGTAGLYNEEMARNAAKSLFDDEEPALPAEDNSFVTGFDKPPAEARPEREVPVRERERPAPRPERQPPSKPRVRPVDERLAEEPYDDRGDEPDIPYIRRERTGSMPAPRPAVKVNVTSAGPRAGAPQNRPARAGITPARRDEGEEPGEEVINSFRQRYKDRESIPSPRYPEPGRSSRPGAPSRLAHSLPDRDFGGGYDDAEPISRTRWVIIGIIAVFLLIAAILVYQVVSLSGQVKTLEAASTEKSPESEAEITTLRLENEGLKESLDAANTRITELEDTLAQTQAAPEQTTSDDPASDPGGPVSPPGGENPTPITTPTPAAQTYVVASGDNLSKISNRFYNSTSLDNIQKIRDANGLTDDNIQIGQTLIIP